MRRIWLAFGLMAALGACATTYPGEPASAHDEERVASGDPEDPFVLTIDIGRTAVFNDRISQALELLPNGYPEREGMSVLEVQQREARDQAASLRRTALEFLVIETNACAEGKLVEISCKGGPMPAWLAEAPGTKVSLAEIRTRLDALQQRMDPLLSAACDAGNKLSKDEDRGMFCSVE